MHIFKAFKIFSYSRILYKLLSLPFTNQRPLLFPCISSDDLSSHILTLKIHWPWTSIKVSPGHYFSQLRAKLKFPEQGNGFCVPKIHKEWKKKEKKTFNIQNSKYIHQSPSLLGWLNSIPIHSSKRINFVKNTFYVKWLQIISQLAHPKFPFPSTFGTRIDTLRWTHVCPDKNQAWFQTGKVA